MGKRAVYLAKSGPTTQRSHFGIFIPNAGNDHLTLGEGFRSALCHGIVIHVVGEPLMRGYHLEIKRNYEASTSQNFRKLIFIGYVDECHLYEPESRDLLIGDSPKGKLETEAASVTPPPRGQNIRLPVDGVNTKRCQEWTMEYLNVLVEKGLLDEKVISIAQKERDAPNFGIFGHG